jgi:hypothetical protein
MNSRRFTGAPSSGLGPDITTPLRKKAAVHHSKNCAMMSQMGQARHVVRSRRLRNVRYASIPTELMRRNELQFCVGNVLDHASGRRFVG